VPHHPARLQLEERVQRLAIAAQHCADLADRQGLAPTAAALTETFETMVRLASALSENRQPKLWSLPGAAVRSPARDAAA
jgi:hypothetical protein